MTKPLAGIKVVEVAMWAFVPAAGGILSDMGANVIKVEPPEGDPIRSLTIGGYGPGSHGFVVSWENYNRGKRSITIDLKVEGAVELLHKLLEDADVFLTNLLPRARRKFKIDIDDIRDRHPNIIYAVGSGSGAHGPDSEKGGYDSISFWSRGGVASAVTPDHEPYPLQMPSGAYGDCTSAAILAGGVAAALAQRAMTGKASVVDVSLLAASMWVMQRSITTATLAGVMELPKPHRTTSTNPLVGFYRTADNRYIAMSMLSAQRYWANFCRAVGRHDLADDPRFDTDAGRTKNAAVCIAELEAIFATRPLSEWTTILATQEGQWDVVQHPGELQYDRQVIANSYMQDVHYDDGRTLKMVSTPIQFDREAFPPRPAPDVGAHSDEVLAELGLNDDQIIDLKVAGIVF